MNANLLKKRAQILFKALVERYIREGQPVSSKTLAVDTELSSGLSLSSATVRAVLSELEDQGYLHSPHTSAGRIPTARGYRLFVDSLLTVHPVSPIDIRKVKTELTQAVESGQPENLVSVASSIMSNMTLLTGLVTVPRQRRLILTHVEFLPLSEQRLLVILVLNNHDVQNRIIHVEREYSASELHYASNYLNKNFAGKELSQLKRELKNNMKQDKREIDELLQSAINMPSKMQDDFVMSGQSRLLDPGSTADMTRLKELFEAFTQKRDILHLLEQCLQVNGVQLYIGEESGYKMLDDYTLVTSPYSANGQIVGVLAVIGPTRMAYERVIPVVDITAKLLSAALTRSD